MHCNFVCTIGGKMTQKKDLVIQLCNLLQDAKAQNVVALDVSQLNTWADFFVIITASSRQQMKGFEQNIKDFAKQNSLEAFCPIKKTPDGDDWLLVDISGIVVHIMQQHARDFYDLEGLWKNAKKVF